MSLEAEIVDVDWTDSLYVLSLIILFFYQEPCIQENSP